MCGDVVLSILSSFAIILLRKRELVALLYTFCLSVCICLLKGAQWPSGRVLDSRPRGRGSEPHRRHCVVVLEQDTFILA